MLLNFITFKNYEIRPSTTMKYNDGFLTNFNLETISFFRSLSIIEIIILANRGLKLPLLLIMKKMRDHLLTLYCKLH